MDEKNLMNMAQAAKKLNVNYQTLVAAFRRGAIVGDKSKNLVDLESARQYFEGKNKVAFADLNLDFDEVLRPLDFISQNFSNQPQRIATPINYLVSSKGQVYNATHNRTLTPSLASHGYLQVKLSDVYMRIHVLVALGFCSNKLGKSNVHHIDGNIVNNNADNLIWLTKNQHKQAHRLLKEDKNEYKKFIADMKKENTWDGEYRPLVLELPERTYFAWISKDTWRDYQNNLLTLDEIYFSDIGAERTIYKEVVQVE